MLNYDKIIKELKNDNLTLTDEQKVTLQEL
jgi:hypothetical protein